MSTQQDKLLDIAAAIREVGGTTSVIVANNFATEIRNLKNKLGSGVSLLWADIYYKSGSYYYAFPHDDASQTHDIFARTDCYVLIFIPKSYVNRGTVSSGVSASISNGSTIALGSKTTTTLTYVSGGGLGDEFDNTVYCYSITNKSQSGAPQSYNYIKTNVTVPARNYVQQCTVSFDVVVSVLQPSTSPD